MINLLFAILIASPDCHQNKIEKIEESGKLIYMEDGATYRIRNSASYTAYGWIHGDPVSICLETTIINLGAGETIYHALRLK
jgi:hypothetical protein